MGGGGEGLLSKFNSNLSPLIPFFFCNQSHLIKVATVHADLGGNY